MMIKAESYKIFSEIYCPIVPAPLELYFGDGCRSVEENMIKYCLFPIHLYVNSDKISNYSEI